jgi:hypothetical protein
MPELRQNYFTKEWVIIATERATRREELVSRRVPKRRRIMWRPAHSVLATRTKLRQRSCVSRPRQTEHGRCVSSPTSSPRSRPTSNRPESFTARCGVWEASGFTM